MATRILVSEVDEHGGECRAGNRRGYKTPAAAFTAAKRLANATGKSHCIAEYEVVGDDSDCLEVLGYEHPENSVYFPKDEPWTCGGCGGSFYGDLVECGPCPGCSKPIQFEE